MKGDAMTNTERTSLEHSMNVRLNAKGRESIRSAMRHIDYLKEKAIRQQLPPGHPCLREIAAFEHLLVLVGTR